MKQLELEFGNQNSFSRLSDFWDENLMGDDCENEESLSGLNLFQEF